MGTGSVAMNEDCLTLNVFAPTADGSRASASLPVLVWIHGGAFTNGTANASWYDGSNLAARSCVVVTINYRLGAFGFTGADDVGLLDQLAALQWVHANIGNFGGDAGNVTIFGQSVGASCVNTLMATPRAHKFFHRAIGQSGGSMVPLGRPGGGSMLRLDEAERIGLRVMESFGCRTIEEMRALPASDINLRWPRDPMARPFMVVDRAVIPEDRKSTRLNSSHRT